MNYEKVELLYEGKAKSVFKVKDQDELLWLHFKNSLTAFNGGKKEELENKGQLNAEIATMIFKFLSQKKIEHHWISTMSEVDMVCKKLKMIPLEVVVRNILAGSTAKKFNIEEGAVLEKPLVEFFYKEDSLNDPFISDEQALMLKTVNTQEDLDQLKKRALDVNDVLLEFFKEAQIKLVDFKLEFGWDQNGHIVLGDEITPDSCRLWDLDTNEKLDKDRFRRDLGQVSESYQEVLKRIQNIWGEKL